MSQRYNIIYFVCHDLGRYLGCYGAPVRSPNLDRFAAEGTLFRQAYCSSAVCSPSRACAMTGLPAHQNGIMGLTHKGWGYFPDVKTVFDYLNEAGYETVHAGLSHEGEEGNRRYSLNFENSWRSRDTECALDDAIAYLTYYRNREDRGDSPKPFYLNIGTQDVHPGTWVFDRKAGSDEPTRFHTTFGAAPDADNVTVPDWAPDKSIFRDLYARFQAAIEYLDRQIQRLFDVIEATGRGDDTLVIFTTDHGMYGQSAKNSLYEQGLETALLMQLPKALREQAPSTIDALIQNLDLTPTLLDLAGADIPEELVGKSFWPLLTGGVYEPHEEIIAEWNCSGSPATYRPSRTLRTSRYRYVRQFHDSPIAYWPPDGLPERWRMSQTDWRYPWPDPRPEGPMEELFDVLDDPSCLKNLADNPALESVRQDHEHRLLAWMKEHDDVALTDERPESHGTLGFSIPSDV